ncbi:C40 family peptidase [Ureibacillus acetophenoni]|uniref:Cell wall-associated NlpC family hydrolase n=1 Tax=Ureibacillus acetophenoni TaxID=614649 RepID=A0A285U4W1_9BACL|nr:SH3 domain-containing C40 family peptidase [Ureibacillus acetophenoni]SOC36458.1 cell wall-associated NlpC family hydrolase [Ureibacillus acetophenoni]
MKAIVNNKIVNLHAKPDTTSELIDEVLYGMVVDVLEFCDESWVRIQTTYRYEGYCLKEKLLIDEEKSLKWQEEAKNVIIQNFSDILAGPKIQSTKIATLVKGSFVTIVEDSELDQEWAKVKLASGEVGYTRSYWVRQTISERVSEEEFRENVVQTALSYLTTPYRWGGKSPLGIDCSGLCSMAYMLNGVLIYRDAKIVEGFPIKQIEFDQIQKGDLLYFPGHIAMYMGDGLYVHSSLGGNEVSINSLNENHPHYRKDLATSITAVGSLFAKELVH